MGRPRDTCGAFPRHIPRPVRVDRRGRRDARLGRLHRGVRVAVSPTGDSVRPEDRLRHMRADRAGGISQMGGARMTALATRQSALVIETPEGVVFSYELATPVSRAFAWVVDALILGTAMSVINKSSSAFGALD